MLLTWKKISSGHTFHTLQQAPRPRILAAWETKNLETVAQLGRQKTARDQAGFLQRKLPSQLPPTPTDSSFMPFKLYLSSENLLFQTHGGE